MCPYRRQRTSKKGGVKSKLCPFHFVVYFEELSPNTFGDCQSDGRWYLINN